MIEPVNDSVVKLWNNPGEMLAMWDAGPEKVRREAIVAERIQELYGNGGVIADLGCGPGRFASVLLRLAYAEYYGYDGSTAMIQRAKGVNLEGFDVHFSTVDIFSYASDREYDLAIMIDVAQHQAMPLNSILKVLRQWKAKWYAFSLLVGDVREELSMSVVVPFSGFLNVQGQLDSPEVYMERQGQERFAWVFVVCQGIA